MTDYGGTPPLKRCVKCVIPETQDAVTFDKDGVCSVCRNVEFKNTKIDWKKRKEELLALVEDYRGKYDYDCIIPFSGGKDSTFQLYYVMKELKLKPLVVAFDHGFFRPTNRENADRALKKLGADYLHFRPNWHIVKKLMVESFIRKGDFCWHCHTGIYSYPIRMAIKLNIPLLMWGESVAEYMSYYNFESPEEVDEERFNKCVNLGITAQDMLGMINDPTVTARDLLPYTYPSLRDFKKAGIKSVCLGTYIPWDPRTQSDLISKELGWKGDLKENVAPQYYYEKVECGMQGVRDYIRFIKRGYGRTAHLTSIDIRNGRMDRKEALQLTKEYDGKRPPSLDIFLKITGLTEEEFNETARSHSISPYVHDFKNTKKEKKLHDQDEWRFTDED